ncbi:MAG: DUF1161 domain-containing protein [Burkholderiaceae bacterium]
MNRYTAIKTALTALLLHALPCSAITCDELRTEVEAKIRGGGVTLFTVTVMDVATPATGRVVGSCDRGSKKLVYQQTNVSAGPTDKKPASAPPTPTRSVKQEAPIPTECRDGSISMTGTCKQP